MDIFKFTVRVGHILSTTLLSGYIIYNYASDGEMEEKVKEHPNYHIFHTYVSVLVFATGLINIFLVKDGRTLTDPIHSMWQHFFELKMILSLFLTPLIYPLTVMFAADGEQYINENLKSQIQFYLVIFFAFYSSFIRYFREEVCNGFKADVIMQKVMQLQDRYDQSAKSDKPLVEPPTRADGYAKKDSQDPRRKLEEEKQWMEDQQKSFMASHTQQSKRQGQTGGTGGIQSQIEELRKKEEYINRTLGRFQQTNGENTAPTARQAEAESDDNIENPKIVSEDEEIDEQTLREMREMYGDEMLGGDSGEEISETEETLQQKMQDQDVPQTQELDEVLRRANAEAEERIRRLTQQQR